MLRQKQLRLVTRREPRQLVLQKIQLLHNLLVPYPFLTFRLFKFEKFMTNFLHIEFEKFNGVNIAKTKPSCLICFSACKECPSSPYPYTPFMAPFGVCDALLYTTGGLSCNLTHIHRLKLSLAITLFTLPCRVSRPTFSLPDS